MRKALPTKTAKQARVKKAVARRPRARTGEQDSARFIDALTELSCGDQYVVPDPLLRQYIDWDNPRYAAVKSRLMEQGLVLARKTAKGKMGVAAAPATKVTYANHFVAFIDVLGFGQLIERSAREDSSEIARSLAVAIETTRRYLSRLTAAYAFSLTQFSDSFVVSLKQDAAPRDAMVFGMAIQRVIEEFLSIGLVLRGAIACGKLIHNKDLLFGPAMNRAYQLESSRARVPRIIIDPELERSEQDFSPLTLARDADGLLYVDYFNLNKAFYLMPLTWRSISNIVAAMPTTDALSEKKNWLREKHNAAVARFDLPKFMARLQDRAAENQRIAQNYANYLAAARSLSLI